MNEVIMKLTENQKQKLIEKATYEYVDNMDSKQKFQYIYDDMVGYYEKLPDNDLLDELYGWFDEDMIDEIIEDKFVGYADITIEAETEEEAIQIYKDGNYKDCNYNLDEYFYEYEFNSIREETNENN